jgi:circadian clock protein KaiC
MAPTGPAPDEPVPKLPTGIAGFDQIAMGGLPAGRPTLVAGTTGSGKTLFAAEFLARGIVEHDEPGVFVTFEEQPPDIRTNVASLGFDITRWETDDRWAFVDASPDLTDTAVVGDYDFNALIARIGLVVRDIGAPRVVLDSIGSLFGRFDAAVRVREELFRMAHALRDMGVTAVLTSERQHDDNSIGRFGVEEFVIDNLVILRNVSEDEKRRRTIEILKFRGAPHRSGEYSFAITRQGLTVLPISLIGQRPQASEQRVNVDGGTLDEMLAGGVFRDSVTLVAAPTGAGKSLLATTFAATGAAAGDRVLLMSFEESREQILRNAHGWGIDLESMETAGLLRVESTYPEVASLEDHFAHLRHVIDRFQPQRCAIDNLSALERIATNRGLRDFIVGFTGFLRRNEITALFTSATTSLSGAATITESHASALTDAIIVLRYIESDSRIRRVVCVLKQRSSAHDPRIREFTIDGRGMSIGEPIEGASGLLAGVVGPWSMGNTTASPAE